MADVTHVLENLLDRIRKGELALREEMIDAFLAAGDVLKTLLAAHKGEGEADPAVVEATCARLRALTGDAGSAPRRRSAAAAEHRRRLPMLEFVIDGDPATHKNTMDNLLAELGSQGDVTARRCTVGSRSSPIGSRLIGHPDADQVRGVLEFVARSDSIRIEALGAEPGR